MVLFTILNGQVTRPPEFIASSLHRFIASSPHRLIASHPSSTNLYSTGNEKFCTNFSGSTFAAKLKKSE